LASWTRHRIGVRQRHRRRIAGAPARFASPFGEPRPHPRSARPYVAVASPSREDDSRPASKHMEPSTIRRESHTVADSMRRQGLQGRRPKHRKAHSSGRESAEIPGSGAPRLHRHGAERPLVRRRHRDSDRRGQALPRHRAGLVLPQTVGLPHQRASGCRAGVRRDQDRYSGARWPRRGRRVVFHSERGSTYTARSFTGLCERLGVRQSMGRVGSCFDNAAAEAFFSTLEHEVLSRHHFTTRLRLAPSWSPGALTSTTPDGGIPPGLRASVIDRCVVVGRG
jgi:transposase InsO family protein